jgi:hypothetical protein
MYTWAGVLVLDVGGKDRSEWLLGLERISALCAADRCREADSTSGLAGAKLPGGAVELAEAEDLSVARALCAESGVESARAQTGERFLREPGKSRSRGLFL